MGKKGLVNQWINTWSRIRSVRKNRISTKWSMKSVSTAHAQRGGIILAFSAPTQRSSPQWIYASLSRLRLCESRNGNGTSCMFTVWASLALCATRSDMTGSSTSTSSSSSRSRGSGAEKRPRFVPVLLAYSALIAACALCYSNSLWGEFVHDDVWAIVNNPDVRPGSSLRSIFTNDFWGKRMVDNTSHKSYRPLCVLTFKWVRPCSRSELSRATCIADLHICWKGRVADNLGL